MKRNVIDGDAVRRGVVVAQVMDPQFKKTITSMLNDTQVPYLRLFARLAGRPNDATLARRLRWLVIRRPPRRRPRRAWSYRETREILIRHRPRRAAAAKRERRHRSLRHR